ncbi:hypothetical protein SAMN05444369_110114 [Capnocytophaga haemolytica]|uniref:Uncharacterized protein n=1 Tax=Capnocytophaga haemolytica TaxID=45243 RepID=A0AAX2GXM7_9FLAO|nr:hypothetical protein SAMN05444369_110114 [Capnocytophaga haemolytica]SNV02613.1 Uncharacterised protein [Capnocytophaga haemolytica]
MLHNFVYKYKKTVIILLFFIKNNKITAVYFISIAIFND